MSAAEIADTLAASVTRREAGELAAWLRQAATTDALDRIDALKQDPGLSLAQKEAILLRLTRHLRSRVPTPADRVAIQALSEYRSRVLTAHHDDPRHTQPAFTVAASARGTLNEWRYHALCDALLDADGAQILQRWRNAGAGGRRELLRALRTGDAGGDALRATLATTRERPGVYPELALTAALALGEGEVAGAAIVRVPSPVAVQAIKRLGRDTATLTPEQTLNLLETAGRHPDPAVAGLALHRRALVQPDAGIVATLTQRLSDPQAGAGAALSLAHVLTDVELADLAERADRDDPWLQARIRLIRQLRGEVR